jgi:hypothetical protein
MITTALDSRPAWVIPIPARAAPLAPDFAESGAMSAGQRRCPVSPTGFGGFTAYRRRWLLCQCAAPRAVGCLCSATARR